MSAGGAKRPWRIDRDEVLRYLGYAGQPIDAELDARIDGIVARCERELAPRWVSARFAVSSVADEGDPTAQVLLEGTPLALTGRDICAHLRGATQCALVACTLGATCEAQLRRLSATSPLEAVVYDAAASALVEAGIQAAQDEVCGAAARDGLVGNGRFSPGYGDLPLSVQPMLLAACDATRRLGLTVLASGMLAPSKSITAVIGLFSGDDVDRGRRAGCGAGSCTHCALRSTCALSKRVEQEKG